MKAYNPYTYLQLHELKSHNSVSLLPNEKDVCLFQGWDEGTRGDARDV